HPPFYRPVGDLATYGQRLTIMFNRFIESIQFRLEMPHHRPGMSFMQALTSRPMHGNGLLEGRYGLVRPAQGLQSDGHTVQYECRLRVVAQELINLRGVLIVT